jgi:endonuclease/exonuclease/phosphatase (EEP) superfamily protein YafD
VAKKPEKKGQTFFLIVLYGWLFVCLLTPLLPASSFVHSIFTYTPPLALCIPIAFFSLLCTVRLCNKRFVKQNLFALSVLLLITPTILGFRMPISGVAENNTAFRVMTFNAFFSNHKVPGLADTIRERNLDVVLLQEVSKGSSKATETLQHEFPNWHLITEGDVAIFSRWPLQDVESHKLRSKTNRCLLGATVNAPQPFRVFTTHWSVPQITKGIDKLQRTLQAQTYDYEDTAEILRNQKLPIVVGADFNNPPRHRFSILLSEQFEDAFTSCGFGPGWTYPSGRPYTRIDHLYCSKPLQSVKAEVGPSFGSDHRSVIAEFQWDQPTDSR